MKALFALITFVTFGLIVHAEQSTNSTFHFIPLSKIEAYLGMKYPTPSLSMIFGGLEQLKSANEAQEGYLCIPKPREESYSENDFVDLGSIDQPVGPQNDRFTFVRLTTSELAELKRLILSYDSFGDRTLCVFKPDIYFRIKDHDRELQIMFCYSCQEIFIQELNTFGTTPRTIAPEVLSYVKEIAEKYLPEDIERSQQYKEWL